jgi:2,3,4,5-tetrahydropyridine-2-carboxylate N-succinyltransferase
MLQQSAIKRISDIHHQLSQGHHLQNSDKNIIFNIIDQLNTGDIRVCEKKGGIWITHTWVKEAILCYLKIQSAYQVAEITSPNRDLIPPKHMSMQDLISDKIRNVPYSYVRHGAYIDKNVVLMPSFTNIGAHIGTGTMIDTWASIGSCAQIGQHCHISAGTGIGGVLEPLQANPTIIEEHCFIGARCEISEGVIVQSGAVIASGTFISASTKIYNRMTKEISFGLIPKNAVVIPGSIPSKDGSHQTNAAIIVKFADYQTRSKTAINTWLRELE